MTATRSAASAADLIARIVPVEEEVRASAAAGVTALATPPGALGRLGDLATVLAAISGRATPPPIGRPGLVIAAGDHGVQLHGVSPYPQEVTALMVRTFCEGRGTANVLADAVGAEVLVLDVGVAGPVPDHPNLRARRIRPGTRDLSAGPAMTADECEAAVVAGAVTAGELLDAGVDLLITGDMGIGNTTASAALIATFTGADPAAVTGRGAGADDATYERKRDIVTAAVARHAGDADPWVRLAGLGGLEHAALVGVLLAGAAARVPVLLDGVIADAAAVAAAALAPDLAGYLIAGHRSTEPGAVAALAHLGLEPLIDLDLRLGEGTGALLAVPTVRAASSLLTGVATLEQVLGA
ncbi:nicotinate-nucleotide--dimethylbenzimidazole phosphoribosyltransferase [Nitriliruptor alkaliphilus]|uniref:nicotinate-nucleotide--dimethylbenzimidazole phosphoribosyltransferase n=1 Tax=Nitriliruptor alkaliphilus TaxID=427918 RepID=UPI000A7D6562|nr:nicotinate-nucleotide--dimethylbenzimidazole phosphoribosyltransferase [Nitriliruptor alkaliphilus]